MRKSSINCKQFKPFLKKSAFLLAFRGAQCAAQRGRGRSARGTSSAQPCAPMCIARAPPTYILRYQKILCAPTVIGSTHTQPLVLFLLYQGARACPLTGGTRPLICNFFVNNSSTFSAPRTRLPPLLRLARAELGRALGGAWHGTPPTAAACATPTARTRSRVRRA